LPVIVVVGDGVVFETLFEVVNSHVELARAGMLVVPGSACEIAMAGVGVSDRSEHILDQNEVDWLTVLVSIATFLDRLDYVSVT
jgi:hypothetical protein